MLLETLLELPDRLNAKAAGLRSCPTHGALPTARFDTRNKGHRKHAASGASRPERLTTPPHQRVKGSCLRSPAWQPPTMRRVRGFLYGGC